MISTDNVGLAGDIIASSSGLEVYSLGDVKFVHKANASERLYGPYTKIIGTNSIAALSCIKEDGSIDLISIETGEMLCAVSDVLDLSDWVYDNIDTVVAMYTDSTFSTKLDSSGGGKIIVSSDSPLSNVESAVKVAVDIEKDLCKRGIYDKASKNWIVRLSYNDVTLWAHKFLLVEYKEEPTVNIYSLDGAVKLIYSYTKKSGSVKIMGKYVLTVDDTVLIVTKAGKVINIQEMLMKMFCIKGVVIKSLKQVMDDFDRYYQIKYKYAGMRSKKQLRLEIENDSEDIQDCDISQTLLVDGLYGGVYTLEKDYTYTIKSDECVQNFEINPRGNIVYVGSKNYRDYDLEVQSLTGIGVDGDGEIMALWGYTQKRNRRR